MKSVSAKFDGSRVYEYFVPEDDKPETGDIIVTSIKLTHEDRAYSEQIVKAARVVAVNEVAGPLCTKFYVQLVSVKGARATHERNVAYKERETAKANAKAALLKKLSERDRMTEFERLALEDPEAADLLKILQAD